MVLAEDSAQGQVKNFYLARIESAKPTGERYAIPQELRRVRVLSQHLRAVRGQRPAVPLSRALLARGLRRGPRDGLASRSRRSRPPRTARPSWSCRPSRSARRDDSSSPTAGTPPRSRRRSSSRTCARSRGACKLYGAGGRRERRDRGCRKPEEAARDRAFLAAMREQLGFSPVCAAGLALRAAARRPCGRCPFRTPTSPVPEGRLSWSLQIQDQRVKREAEARMIAAVRDAVQRSFPGCRWDDDGRRRAERSRSRFIASGRYLDSGLLGGGRGVDRSRARERQRAHA